MEQTKIILLAEDNKKDAELTLEALSENKLSAEIVHVKDGVETMEYLNCEGKYINRKKCNPIVILLDLKMPRMDGIEVLQAIKKDEELRTIPVVMLTSSREEPDLKKCYVLGVNAYVVKPVNYHDFINIVQQLGLFWAGINELPMQGNK